MLRSAREIKATKGIVLAMDSAQNIDRLVTMFRACVQSRRYLLRDERHEGLTSFMQSLMYVVAAGLVFWAHGRLGQRAHAMTAAPAVPAV